MTKPSRPVSQGRDARSGVSLYWVERARAAAKPAGHHHVRIVELDETRRVA
jgi:hypothetical protein